MSTHDLSSFFLQLAIMASAAFVCGGICRRFGQPAIFGELLGGIILGPTIFGSLAPEFFVKIFSSSGPAFIAREGIVKIALLFFLFVAGLEMNLGSVAKAGRRVFFISSMGMLVPFSFGYASVLCFPQIWAGQHMDTKLLALFIGTALSISALPVIARILMDLDLMRKPIGSIVVGSAIIDDLLGWTLFAYLLSLFTKSQGHHAGPVQVLAGVVFLFIFMLTVGRFVAQKLIHSLKSYLKGTSGIIALSGIMVLFAATFAEKLGVHAIFGAFLMGIALNRRKEVREESEEVMHQFVAVFFGAPIYFVSIGLKINFIEHFDWALVLIVLFVATVGKTLGAYLGARLGKMSFRESAAVGFAMNARGAMEIILASLALDYGLIDEKIFVALVVMAIATSLLAGPMVQKILGLRKTNKGALNEQAAIDL